MRKINYFLVFLFVIIASLKANAFNINSNVEGQRLQHYC